MRHLYNSLVSNRGNTELDEIALSLDILVFSFKSMVTSIPVVPKVRYIVMNDHLIELATDRVVLTKLFVYNWSLLDHLLLKAQSFLYVGHYLASFIRDEHLVMLCLYS